MGNNKAIFSIILVILLIITSYSTSAVNQNPIEEREIEESIKNEPEAWKRNYFCRINLLVYGSSKPELGIGLMRNVYLEGRIRRGLISGVHGVEVFIEGDEIEIKIEYLFGLTFYRLASFLSEAEIIGYAYVCEYKVI